MRYLRPIQTWIVLLAAALLPLCGQQSNVWKVPAAFAIDKPTITEGDVMVRLFGNYSAAQRISIWISDPMFEEQSSDAAAETVASRVILSDTSRPNQLVLLLSTTPSEGFFDCRPCAPIISVADLKRNNSVWQLASYAQLGPMGSYGQPPDATLKRLSQEINVFVLATGDVHMGFSSANVRFVGPTSAGYSVVFEMNTSFSNEGACEPERNNCAENVTEISVTQAPYYPDIVTVTRGTDIEDLSAPSQPVDRTTTWRFDGREYR
ncbi:MAG: hypothetical protein K1X75_16340 [Leptospirales bacterium]|nr:hypothetical protein [Leptospirales bacterium]